VVTPIYQCCQLTNADASDSNFDNCARIQMLVHGQVTIIFVVSVCLFVCAEFFSAVFDPIWIKLGHMLHVRV